MNTTSVVDIQNHMYSVQWQPGLDFLKGQCVYTYNQPNIILRVLVYLSLTNNLYQTSSNKSSFGSMYVISQDILNMIYQTSFIYISLIWYAVVIQIIYFIFHLIAIINLLIIVEQSQLPFIFQHVLLFHHHLLNQCCLYSRRHKSIQLKPKESQQSITKIENQPSPKHN